MLYHILYPLREFFFAFNVFRYITFRSVAAFSTSFLLVFIFWKQTIERLRRMKVREHIDMYGHVHLEQIYAPKRGTPTMGGVLIIFSVVLSTLLWSRLNNAFIWYALLCMILLGLAGMKDDLRKTRKRKGLTRRQKLIYQIGVGIVVGIIACIDKNVSTTLHFPFLKNFIVDLGYFYIFWSALIIVATSNAVNFADGLDGLAVGSVAINCFVFAILSYLVGHFKLSEYLFIPFVRGAGELTVFCMAIVGAGLAFLWFNAPPAQVFMGDVGALSLGGALGVVALFIKKEFVLLIAGGVFVAEALSVVAQILSVKLRGKKIFKAAPLHHHFQLLGWSESQIMVRLWIVSIVLAAISLLTLKLR